MARVLLAVVLLVLPTLTPAAETPPDSLLAPTFRVQTVEGDTLDLEKLRGSVVVLDFWHLGCSSCASEISGLNQLALAFEGDDVVFVALATNAKKALERFLRQRPFYYRHVADAVDLAAAYGVEVADMPVHLVIGKDGRVLHRRKGGSLTTATTLRRIIASALE